MELGCFMFRYIFWDYYNGNDAEKIAKYKDWCIANYKGYNGTVDGSSYNDIFELIDNNIHRNSFEIYSFETRKLIASVTKLLIATCFDFSTRRQGIINITKHIEDGTWLFYI